MTGIPGNLGRASVRIVTTARRPSATLLRACARFGLAVRRGRGADGMHDGRARRGAAALDALAVAGGLTLLLGPSGSGKTTALRALAARVRRRRGAIVAPSDSRRAKPCALIDLLPGPLDERLGVLASAGLGEAARLARRVGELSEGERARARLAMAMARCARLAARGRPCTLLIDEFTSGLDRATAVSLCASLARWCARHRAVRAIGASSREDLAGTIRGASVVRVRDLSTDKRGLKGGS